VPAQASFKDELQQQDELYRKELDRIDPERLGVRLICPHCSAVSWVRLPEQRYGVMPLMLACPAACGHYGPINEFQPSPLDLHRASGFDRSETCRHDGAETRFNGRFFRCPVCAYENPREIMRELTAQITKDLASSPNRDRLSDLLARIVSTFDGVMRSCNSVATRNAAGGMYPFSQVSSFQNLLAAREKMLPHWDMATAANDWRGFVIAFQKRHCFSHTLGVADQSYIDKSGDPAAVVGRDINLSGREVLVCAQDAERIVRSFFGHYLS
jgi:hypothetical protein